MGPAAHSDTLKIFSNEPAGKNVEYLQELARCVGIAAEVIGLQDPVAVAAVVDQHLSVNDSGVVFDVDSLKHCEEVALERVSSIVGGRRAACLLLASSAGNDTDRVLRTLTRGVVRGCASRESARAVSFPHTANPLAGELAGQSYSRGQGAAVTLDVGAKGAATVIMSLDNEPSYVVTEVRQTRVFVWSTRRVFDVLRPLAAEKEFEDATDEYVPPIIFLRSAFGDRCWHTLYRGAGIVIDDPLLKRHYGFIDFPELLGSARRHGYHVSLAFIPWNHWRTRLRDMGLFRAYADCFSVCVHGCDHTSNEYGVSDYESLLRKNHKAKERMERHNARTGLNYEAMMVCPQEEYSIEAMRAFADSRKFLGLANTSCIPRSPATNRVCAADLLLPAQDSFFGFAIFKRHYWYDVSPFAMALFLGKPAILVEHHQFFRGGPARAEEFASKVGQMGAVKWGSMADIATRTHRRRTVSHAKVEVQFFTDVFVLEHHTAGPTDYVFHRRIGGAAVRRVLVNGHEVPFSIIDGDLSCESRVLEPRTVRVEIDVAAARQIGPYAPGLRYQTLVAVRRVLSELRDEVLSKNEVALKTAKRLVNAMKAAG